MTWENLDALFSYSTSHAGIVFCHFTASRTHGPFDPGPSTKVICVFQSSVCVCCNSVHAMKCKKVWKFAMKHIELWLENGPLKTFFCTSKNTFFLRSSRSVAVTLFPLILVEWVLWPVRPQMFLHLGFLLPANLYMCNLIMKWTREKNLSNN